MKYLSFDLGAKTGWAVFDTSGGYICSGVLRVTSKRKGFCRWAAWLEGVKVLLKGIVEMDETYIGGKPRNKGDGKRGRGTDKLPIIGAVERDGSVRAEPARGKKVNFSTLSDFVKRKLDLANARLVTDEYRGYNGMVAVLPHSTINHSIAYVFNDLHTNTIEGFWSLLKRAWYGQHHHYSEAKSYLYIGEACYKYNNRKNKNTFSEMIGKMLKKGGL